MILLYCNIFASNTSLAAITKFPYELSEQGWTLSGSIKWTEKIAMGRPPFLVGSSEGPDEVYI